VCLHARMIAVMKCCDAAGQYYGLVMTYNPASTLADATAADFQRKSTIVRVSHSCSVYLLNSVSTRAVELVFLYKK